MLQIIVTRFSKLHTNPRHKSTPQSLSIHFSRSRTWLDRGLAVSGSRGTTASSIGAHSNGSDEKNARRCHGAKVISDSCSRRCSLGTSWLTARPWLTLIRSRRVDARSRVERASQSARNRAAYLLGFLSSHLHSSLAPLRYLEATPTVLTRDQFTWAAVGEPLLPLRPARRIFLPALHTRRGLRFWLRRAEEIPAAFNL